MTTLLFSAAVHSVRGAIQIPHCDCDCDCEISCFLKTTAKKLGDQLIVGPPTYKSGDQSPPVPTVVVPMRRLKTRDWKTRDWKTRHQTVGVENAGLENAAPDCRGGKRGSSTVWKAEVSVI